MDLHACLWQRRAPTLEPPHKFAGSAAEHDGPPPAHLGEVDDLPEFDIGLYSISTAFSTVSLLICTSCSKTWVGVYTPCSFLGVQCVEYAIGLVAHYGGCLLSVFSPKSPSHRSFARTKATVHVSRYDLLSQSPKRCVQPHPDAVTRAMQRGSVVEGLE